MTSLLMVGGGVQELEAVHAARRNGFYVIVTDRDSSAPCALAADEFYRIDGRDAEGLVSLGLHLRSRGRLDGVFTFTELVTSVALIAQACGLPGASVAEAVICQDKGLSKNIWHRRGVSTPKGMLFYGDKAYDELLDQVVFPLIVKPVKGSGGRGMSIINDANAFLAWYIGYGSSVTYDNRVVIEEFVQGSSHDVNGLFDENGKFHPYGIVDRNFLAESVVEASVIAPTKLTSSQQGDLYSLLESACRAVGINSGPVKGDSVLTDAGFKMLEIAPRLHGPKCSLYALPAVMERYLECFFSILVGNSTAAEFALTDNGRFFRSSLISVNPGYITSISGVSGRAVEDDGKQLVEFLVFKDIGDAVSPPESSHDVFGYVMCSANSEMELEQLVAKCIQDISVETI